ncbi:MAG: hypothetical protein AB1758_12690 [Candidatus Eremiobacterota bacterium]
MRFYMLEKPAHPWGDFHDILMHGRALRQEGTLHLERTAPFVPPISQPNPGDLVVTDEFRRMLKVSGLQGLAFRAVVKRRIVLSDWHNWDPHASWPEVFPRESEPEGYLLDSPHSEALSDQLGDLWEVVLEDTARIRTEKPICESPEEVALVGSSWKGADLFRARGFLLPYATQHARTWLSTYAADIVSFVEARVI